MRALRFDGKSVALDPRSPDPAPGLGEALLRPLRLAVGPAEVRIARGRSGFRGVLGQEFAAVVERLHEGAAREERKRWEGKRVVGAANIACGKCDLCRAGLASHCRARRELGALDCDGCMADRFVLPLRNLIELPAGVDDDRAVFAQPLAAALHAAHAVRIEGKPYITVLGDSVDGMLCAQVMARLNASVRLLGSDPRKLALCEKWERAATGGSGEGIKHRLVDEAGRRHDQDVVVECTGTPEGLDLALQLVRPRGKVVLRSWDGPPRGADLGPVVAGEIELIGARSGSVADAVVVLDRSDVDVLSLISRRMRLDEGAAILQAATDPAQIKVLIEP